MLELFILVLIITALIIWGQILDKQQLNSPNTQEIDNKKNHDRLSPKILLEKIRNYRPREVYFISTILFICLFMDASEIFDGDFDQAFNIRDSIIFGLIRGIGDDNLRYGSAEILYWICAIIFVFLTVNKTKRISNWLWNE